MRIPSIISIALFATLAPAASAQTNAPLAPGTARVVGIRTMDLWRWQSLPNHLEFRSNWEI
jgi:hypothetical protein